MRRKLKQAVEDLAGQHPEIEHVILFGSLARGDAVPGSDADVLMVVGDSALPFRDRSLAYDLVGVGLGVDLLVYTRAEFERMLADGNPFATHAVHEGVLLFERTAPR